LLFSDDNDYFEAHQTSAVADCIKPLLTDPMKIIECAFDRAPEILEIFNHEILHSTGLYDYEVRTMTTMEAWFAAKTKGKFPVLGAIGTEGELAGFASYGPFRPWPAYKYSVEHSVYIRRDRRGRGLGKHLVREVLAVAQRQGYHTVIGGIDSLNVASIKLHQSLGFIHCASIKQVGFKFGRWLDLEFYQFIAATPEHPVDG
jgi:phosphinothricin acetyltransferase